MKAIVYKKYGNPNVLNLSDIPKPLPKENEVLVKICASTVTTADSRLRSLNVPFGFGLISRLALGITGPRRKVQGVEFSGIIETIGKNVKDFKVGDEVFGSSDKMGCHAEYQTISEKGNILIKPNNLTFKEAAAVSFGALSSLYYLRDLGKIKKGQKVLINGASGCLGTYAVQIARHFDAHVTAVCSGSNFKLVKSIGANTAIDYTIENFTNNDEKYDIIFDTVGKITYSEVKNSLTKKGRFLLAVAGLPEYLEILFTLLFTSKKALAGVALNKKEDLIFIKELIESQKIKPIIDRCYKLEEISEAHLYVDMGHKKGSVVISIES